MTRGRLVSAALLVAVYALPLFWPPGPVLPMALPQGGTMQRLFPGVPPLWVVGRLCALALAAVLLSGASMSAVPDPLRPSAADSEGPGGVRRWLALGAALMLAFAAPWALGLGPIGQIAYLVMAFVPASLLATPASWAVWKQRGAWRGGVPVAGVIALWMAVRLATDLNDPRVADMVDAWRGFVALARASTSGANLLTDLIDPELPGLGAIPFAFLGVPLFQADVLPLTFRMVQVLQILWLAASAVGVALLTRTLVGPGVSVVAVAVFLFAPYTRFVSLFPGPFFAGPIYVTAMTLCATTAIRHRSAAAIAALAALCGVGVTFPGVIPVMAFLAGVTLWSLRRDWARCWLGAATGLAVFAAVVVPAIPDVLTPTRMLQHLRSHGSATLLESALLGQAPIETFAVARAVVVVRPLEIVGAALVEPFANPRTPIRLWGDAIFDPLGAALIAVGLAACLRNAAASPAARFLLLFFGAALSSAFVSPVDRVDIVHAVTLPVPAALLAAAGAAVVGWQCGPWSRRRRRVVTAGAVAAVVVGGTLLFDVVNPRILSASSPGVMFRVLREDQAGRVVVLDYPPEHGIDVRWLFTGAMTAYAGTRPTGYLRYAGGDLPVADLAAAGKDLLFWSPGLDMDLRVTAAVCRQWPMATLYEIRDAAGLGRTYAAQLGAATWTPTGPRERWHRRSCGAASATPTRPAGCRARV